VAKLAALHGRHAGDTAAHFRANMPPAWRPEYEALLKAPQRFAEQRSRDIKPIVWRGLAR